MVRDERLVGPHVPVGGAEHHAIAKAVEHLAVELLDAVAVADVAAEPIERRRGQEHGVGAAVLYVGPVDVIAIDDERIVVEEPDDGRRSPRGRRQLAVEVGGRQAAHLGEGHIHALLRRGRAREHLGTVECADPAGQHLRGAGRAREHVVRRVVGVRPDAELGVVVEVRVREGVQRILTGGIRRARHRDALPERPRELRLHGERELRDEPPVGERVIEDDSIEAESGSASAAQRGEHALRGHRPELQRARLGEDRDRRIDDLHVVVRSDVSLWIGRIELDIEHVARRHADGAETDAIEGKPGRKRPQRGDAALQDRIADRPRGRAESDAPRLVFLGRLLDGRWTDQPERSGERVLAALHPVGS